MDPRISKTLETWHGGDGEEGKSNCLLSMMGETGEIINLYRKRRFKPGYELKREVALDEIGDIWYYVRIWAYLNRDRIELEDLDRHIKGNLFPKSEGEEKLLAALFNKVNDLVNDRLYEHRRLWSPGELTVIIILIEGLLDEWDCSLDELTELNYQKLTKNADHHGWNPSEDLQKMPIEEYKRLTQNTWVEYDEGLEKEVEAAAEMYKESLEKMKKEPPYAIFPQQEENDESSSYEDVPLQEEDWREGMLYRIALLKQESVEKRGRWY